MRVIPMSFCKWCGLWLRHTSRDHEATCPEHDGHAVIARDTFMGDETVSHRFDESLEAAQQSAKTPESAFVFDQWGNVVASSHAPFPPE